MSWPGVSESTMAFPILPQSLPLRALWDGRGGHGLDAGPCQVTHDCVLQMGLLDLYGYLDSHSPASSSGLY